MSEPIFMSMHPTVEPCHQQFHQSLNSKIIFYSDNIHSHKIVVFFMQTQNNRDYTLLVTYIYKFSPNLSSFFFSDLIFP